MNAAPLPEQYATRPGTPMVGPYSTNQMDDFYHALARGEAKPSGLMNLLQHLIVAEQCAPDSRVLDVCCGRGLALPLLYRYAPKIARYVGLDISVDNLDEAKAGNPWSNWAVLTVLRNRTYLGEIWFRDRWYKAEDHHPAIIDEELFTKAQASSTPAATQPDTAPSPTPTTSSPDAYSAATAASATSAPPPQAPGTATATTPATPATATAPSTAPPTGYPPTNSNTPY
jgi:hypothetical protein